MRLGTSYNITRWIITVIAILTLLAIHATVLGEVELSSTKGYLVILEILLPVLIIKRIFMYAQAREIKRQTLIYEDECDPKAYLLRSDNYAKEVTLPYDAWDIWFLDCRCKALLDVEEDEVAKVILKKELTSIEDNDREKNVSSVSVPMTAKKAVETCRICSAFMSVYTRSAGLEFIKAAEEFFLQDPKRYDSELRFIFEQKKIAVAEGSGDPMQIVNVWKTHREDPKLTLRAKVVSAYCESRGHRALCDTKNECELLNYVVEYGSELEVGREALKRLKELDAE